MDSNRNGKSVLNRFNRIVEDDRFSEKERFLFTETWGIDPKMQTSISSKNSDTATTEQKLDPMANGIMLDVVNERTGDVASAKLFGNSSLFKLHSLYTVCTVVRWCANLYSGNNEKISPVLKIGYDSTAEKYKFQYTISDSTLLRICILRFFSRYRPTLSSTVVSN